MRSLQKINNLYLNFFKGLRSLCFSTVDSKGLPLIGYAPFIVDEQRHFFIYLSDLASHTSALRESKNASVLLIEDENNSSEIFARTRIVFQCTVNQLPRESKLWQQKMESLAKRFGDIVTTLYSLSDFHLFKMQPLRGTFINGFGQAYVITGEKMDQLEQVPVEKMA